MDYDKLGAIVREIQRQGKLPTDRWGEVLNGKDLLVWFDLNDILEPEEQTCMIQKLNVLGEVQRTIELMNLKRL